MESKTRSPGHPQHQAEEDSAQSQQGSPTAQDGERRLSQQVVHHRAPTISRTRNISHRNANHRPAYVEEVVRQVVQRRRVPPRGPHSHAASER